MCFASVVLQTDLATESPNNAFCYISTGFQFWDIFLKSFFPFLTLLSILIFKNSWTWIKLIFINWAL